MTVAFEKTFYPRFDVLFKDEPSKSVSVYCYPGAVEDGFVDGVSLELIPQKGESWFGSFAEGEVSQNAVSVVIAMPDRTSVLVISRGEAYIVDTSNPRNWEHLALIPVMGWTVSKTRELVLLWDFSRVVAYGVSGIVWKTPSISWDGVSNVAINKDDAIFNVWNAPIESHQTATVNLRTGVVKGGTSPELLDI